MDTVYVIDAKITNPDGETVMVHVSTVYSPITPEWKKAYRQVALDLAAELIGQTSTGMRVKWIQTVV